MQRSECSTRGSVQGEGTNFPNHGISNWVWKLQPQFSSSLDNAVISCTWAILSAHSQTAIFHQKTWKTDSFLLFYPTVKQGYFWNPEDAGRMKYYFLTAPPGPPDPRNWNICNGHMSICVMHPWAAVTWSSSHEIRIKKTEGILPRYVSVYLTKWCWFYISHCKLSTTVTGD